MVQAELPIQDFFLDDFNLAIWKDKLIAGLLKAFSNLVKAKLGNMNLAEVTQRMEISFPIYPIFF